MKRITQQQFDRVIAKSEKRKSFRGQLYQMGLALLEAGHEIEAYLLILATWNFARFRYFMKTFDLETFRNAIVTTRPYFDRLTGYSFQTADFEALADDMTAIYDTFKHIAEQTGASKILHFRQPRLFVMWDTDIRRNYGLGSSARDYIVFHKCLQSEFGHLVWAREDKTFARAVDQYNYFRAHRE